MAASTPTDGAAARIRRYVCPVSFTHDAAARLFEGHVALVTGAARPRGIGRATAVALARGGADVACLDIAQPYADAPFHGTGSGDDLEAVAAELRQHDVRAITLRADISDEAAVEAAVARATEELGTVTLVANVAGGSGPGFGLGPLLGVPADEFRRVLDVNVVGTWLVSKACAGRMVDAGVGGRICNVSSQAGKRAFPFLGAYCAAKAGVILLTQTMALELGPSGISVNAVCPGTVDTDLINRDATFETLMGGPDGLADFIAREIPLGRLQEADEIAAAIVWLLSDAARGVTGEALNVSAGQTMV
jgi:NAD(P)-dependent dehydrogenase (short-subunit alcohol dehydrogenase family)